MIRYVHSFSFTLFYIMRQSRNQPNCKNEVYFISTFIGFLFLHTAVETRDDLLNCVEPFIVTGLFIYLHWSSL